MRHRATMLDPATALGRPMRVLYVARAPFISGAERALLSMLANLDRSLVEPSAVLGSGSPLEPMLRDLGVPLTTMAMPMRCLPQAVAWWRSLRQMRRAVRHHQPDLLHANDVPSCQAMSVIGGELAIPRVLHVRWALRAADAGWWARHGAEQVLCISRWVQQSLGPLQQTALAAARVSLLRDAVDWPPDAPLLPHAAPPWPRDPIVLGFAGQLVPQKGLDLLMQALAALPSKRRPMLLIAGRDTQCGGAYERQLRHDARRLGLGQHVRWLGFLPDVNVLYRQVSAVVCPSRLEPLGLVPLEAACWSRPAIANRVGGLVETIRDGHTGWLVDPTVQAWQQVLGDLIPPEIARRGVAAFDRVQQRHHQRRYQRQLVRLYHQTLANHRARAMSAI